MKLIIEAELTMAGKALDKSDAEGTRASLERIVDGFRYGTVTAVKTKAVLLDTSNWHAAIKTK